MLRSSFKWESRHEFVPVEETVPSVEQGRAPQGFREILVRLVKAVLVNKPLCIYQCLATTLEAELDRRTLWEMQFNQYSTSVASSSLVSVKVPFHLLPSRNREVGDSSGIQPGDPASGNLTSGSDEQELAFLLECFPNSEKSSLDAKRLKPFLAFELPHADADSTRDEIRVASRSVPQYSTLLAAKAEGLRRLPEDAAASARASGVTESVLDEPSEDGTAADDGTFGSRVLDSGSENFTPIKPVHEFLLRGHNPLATDGDQAEFQDTARNEDIDSTGQNKTVESQTRENLLDTGPTDVDSRRIYSVLASDSSDRPSYIPRGDRLAAAMLHLDAETASGQDLALEKDAADVSDIDQYADALNKIFSRCYHEPDVSRSWQDPCVVSTTYDAATTASNPDIAVLHKTSRTAFPHRSAVRNALQHVSNVVQSSNDLADAVSADDGRVVVDEHQTTYPENSSQDQDVPHSYLTRETLALEKQEYNSLSFLDSTETDELEYLTPPNGSFRREEYQEEDEFHTPRAIFPREMSDMSVHDLCDNPLLASRHSEPDEELTTESGIQQFPQSNQNQSTQSKGLKTGFVHAGFQTGKEVIRNNEDNYESVNDDLALNDESSQDEELTIKPVVERVLHGKESRHDQEVTMIDKETYDESQIHGLSHNDESTQDEELTIEPVVESVLHGKESRHDQEGTVIDKETYDESQIHGLSHNDESTQDEELATESMHDKEITDDSVISEIHHGDEPTQDKGLTSESVVEESLHVKEFAEDKETSDESVHPEFQHSDEPAQIEDLISDAVVETVPNIKESTHDKDTICDKALSQEFSPSCGEIEGEEFKFKTEFQEFPHSDKLQQGEQLRSESYSQNFPQDEEESAQNEGLASMSASQESKEIEGSAHGNKSHGNKWTFKGFGELQSTEDSARGEYSAQGEDSAQDEDLSSELALQEVPHCRESTRSNEMVTNSVCAEEATLYSTQAKKTVSDAMSSDEVTVSSADETAMQPESSLEEEMLDESMLGEETNMHASLMGGEIMNFELVNDEETSKDSVVSGQQPQKVVLQEGTTCAPMLDEENPALENVEIKMSDMDCSAEIALRTLPDEEMIHESKLSEEEISPERKHTEEICKPDIKLSDSVFRKDITSECLLLEEIHTKSEHGEMKVSRSHHSKDLAPGLLLREVIQPELEHSEGTITDSVHSKHVTPESSHDEDTAAENLQADTQESSESVTETVKPEAVFVRPVIEPLYYGKNTYTNYSHASESELLDVMNKPTMSEEKAAHMLEWDEMNLARRESDASLRKQDAASSENPDQDGIFSERDDHEPSVTGSESDTAASQPSLEGAVDHPDCFSNFSAGPSLGREARIRLKWYSISTSCSDVLEEEDEDDESNIARSRSRFDDEGAHDGQTTLQDDSRHSEELAHNLQEESMALHLTDGEPTNEMVCANDAFGKDVLSERKNDIETDAAKFPSCASNRQALTLEDGDQSLCKSVEVCESSTDSSVVPENSEPLTQISKEMEDDKSDVVKEYQVFDKPNQMKSAWDVDTSDEIQVDATMASGKHWDDATKGEECETEETETKKEDVLTIAATVSNFFDEAVEMSISDEIAEENALIEMPADESQSIVMPVTQRDVKENADGSRTLDSEQETDEPVAKSTKKSAGEMEPKETTVSSFESSSDLSHNLLDQNWFDSREGQLHSAEYSSTHHFQFAGKEDSEDIDMIQEFNKDADSPVTEVVHLTSRKSQGTSAERDHDETIKPEKAVILFAAAPGQTNTDDEYPCSYNKTEEESAVEGRSVDISPVHPTHMQEAGEAKDEQARVIIAQKVPIVFAAAAVHGHADEDEPNLIDEGDRFFYLEPDKDREESEPSLLLAHPQLAAEDSEEMDVIREVKDYGENLSSHPRNRSQWDTSFEEPEIIVPQKVDVYSASPIHKCHSKNDSDSMEKADFLSAYEQSSCEEDENAVNDRPLDAALESHPTDVFGLPLDACKASDETKLNDSLAPSNKSSNSKSRGKNVPAVEREEASSEWPPVPQFLSPYYDEDDAPMRRSTVYYNRDDNEWPRPMNRCGSPGSDFSDSDYEEASIYSTEPVTGKRHAADNVSRQNAPDSSDVAAAAAEVSENKVADDMCDTKSDEVVQAFLNAQALESEEWPPLPEFALLNNESDGMESKNAVDEAQSATGATVGATEDQTNVGDLRKASDDDDQLMDDSPEQWPPLPDFILEELVSGRSKSNLCSILNIFDTRSQEESPVSSSEFPAVDAERVGLLRRQGRARVDPSTQQTIYGADSCDTDVTDKISFAGLLSQNDKDELSEFLNEDDFDNQKLDEQMELSVVNQLVLDIVSSAKQSVQELTDRECLTTSESAPTEKGMTSELLDFGSKGPIPTNMLSDDQTATSDELATGSDYEEASIYWTQPTIAKPPSPPVADSVSLQSTPDDVALETTAPENTSKITGPEDNEAGFEVRQFCAVASSAFTDLTKVTGSQGDMKSHHNIQSHIELGVMACQSWSDLDIPPCGSSKSLQLIGAPELSSWATDSSDEANRKWREDDQVGRRQAAEAADGQSAYTGGEAIRKVMENEDVDSGYKMEATEEPLLGCHRDSASAENNERGSRGSSVHIWMPVEEEGLLEDMASKGSGATSSSPMESREKPSEQQSSDVPEAFIAFEGTVEPSRAVDAESNVVTETMSMSAPKDRSTVTESPDEDDRRKESRKVERREVPDEIGAALGSTSSLTGENLSHPKQKNISAGTLDVAEPSGGSNWETDLNSVTEPQENDPEVLPREWEEFEKDDVTVALINESAPFTGSNPQIKISSVEETTSDGFVSAVESDEQTKQTETSSAELCDPGEISASEAGFVDLESGSDLKGLGTEVASDSDNCLQMVKSSSAHEPPISGDLDAPQEAALHSAPATELLITDNELNRVSCSLCKTDRAAMAVNPDTAAAPLSNLSSWVQMGRTWFIEDEMLASSAPSSRKTKSGAEKQTKGLNSFSSALTTATGAIPIGENRANSPTTEKVESVDEEVKLAISTEPESSENDKLEGSSESVSTISLTGANSHLDCPPPPRVVEVEDDNVGLDQDDWVQEDEADEVVSGEQEQHFLPSTSTASEQMENSLFSDASKPIIEHQTSFDPISGEQLDLIQPDGGPVQQLADSTEVTDRSEISSTNVNLELVDENVATDVEESFPVSSGAELGGLKTSSLSNQLESEGVYDSNVPASLPLKGEDEGQRKTQEEGLVEEEQLSVSSSDLHKSSLAAERSPMIHRIQDVEPRTESLKWEDKMQDSSAFNIEDENRLASEDSQTIDSDVKKQVDDISRQHEGLAKVEDLDGARNEDQDLNPDMRQDEDHDEDHDKDHDVDRAENLEKNLDKDRNEDQDVNEIKNTDMGHCEIQDKTQGEVLGTESSGKEDDREDHDIGHDHQTEPITTVSKTDSPEDIDKDVGLVEVITTEENDECVQPIPPHSTKSEIDLVFSLNENQTESRPDSDVIPLNKGSASPTILTGGKDGSIIPVYVLDESPRSKSPSVSPVFLVATQDGGYKVANLEEQNSIGASITEFERESLGQNEAEQSLSDDVQKTYFGTTSSASDDGTFAFRTAAATVSSKTGVTSATETDGDKLVSKSDDDETFASETTEEISASKVEERSASETDGDAVASNINDGTGASKTEVEIVGSEFEGLNDASKIDDKTEADDGIAASATAAVETDANDEGQASKNDDDATVGPFDGVVTSEIDSETEDDETITY